jgi:hypothetical protein
MHLNAILSLSLSLFSFLAQPIFFLLFSFSPTRPSPTWPFPPLLSLLAAQPSSPSFPPLPASRAACSPPSPAQRPACASSLSPPSSHADRRDPPIRVVPDLQHESGLDSHLSPATSRPSPTARSPRPACQGLRPPYKTQPRALEPVKPAAAASHPRSPSRRRH